MATRPLVTAGLTIPPASSLIAAAGQRKLAGAGARSLIPVTYGTDRVPALILNIIAAAGTTSTILIHCLWGHACTGISAVQLGDQALPAGATVTHYTGAQLAPDAALVAAFAAQGITYTDALTGYGHSVIALPTRAFDGQLQITAQVQGRALYDRRKDSTAGGSGTHRLATPSTWEYSDNPSLALADWLASTTYGAGVAVDWASVPAAADANDATVTGVGGTEKRRLIGVTLSQAAPVQQVADALRAYAGCWLVPTAAGVKLLPDADGPSVASYAHSAGQIAALDPLALRDLGNAPTAVEVVYTDTAQIPWRAASVVISVPGAGTSKPWRLSSVPMPGVQRFSQAVREATERLNKLLVSDLATTIEVFDIGIRHEIGDLIDVTHPVGLVAKPFRVIEPIMVGPGRWRLSLAEHDPAAYSNEVQTRGTIPDTPRTVQPVPPDVAGLTVVVARGGLLITWTGIADPDYTETRLRVGASWAAGTPIWSGRATSYVYPVTTTGTFTIYARHANAYNESAAAASASVTVTEDDLRAMSARQIVVPAYQRAGSAPAAPSADATYNFATLTLSGLSGGWSATIPGGTGPLWIIQATASSATSTDTITPVEWSAPQILAQDGAAGAPGSPGAPGAPGAAAVTATLSNEAAVFPADSGGNVTSYAGNSSTMQVSIGGVDDTSNWSFSKTDSAGVSSTRTANVVTVDSLAGGTDAGFVDITASRAGFASITRRFSVSKSKAGVNGTSGTSAYTLIGTGVAINGTTVTKTGLLSQWDAAAHSAERWVGGAYVSFRPQQANAHLMVGLNSDPATNADYGSIDYAWYCLPDGTLQIYESGSYRGDFGAYTSSTRLSVHYDGPRVRYVKDGAVAREVATTNGLVLGLDSSFYTPAGSVAELAFGPSGALGADGLPGQRGSVDTSRTFAGSSWNDSEAVAAITAAGYAGPVNLDRVTLIGSAGYVETRAYSAGGWLPVAAFIHGNLFVDGTITTQKLVVGSVTAAQTQTGSLGVDSYGAQAFALVGAIRTINPTAFATTGARVNLAARALVQLSLDMDAATTVDVTLIMFSTTGAGPRGEIWRDESLRVRLDPVDASPTVTTRVGALILPIPWAILPAAGNQTFELQVIVNGASSGLSSSTPAGVRGATVQTFFWLVAQENKV